MWPKKDLKCPECGEFNIVSLATTDNPDLAYRLACRTIGCDWTEEELYSNLAGPDDVDDGCTYCGYGPSDGVPVRSCGECGVTEGEY